MRLTQIVFGISCLLLMTLVTPVGAVPKGKNGEACNVSSETGVKHTIKGKEYKCDKCVYSKCDAGSTVSNCQQITHWSNCEEVAASRPGAGNVGTIKGGVLAPDESTPPKTHKLPKADAPAIRAQ